MRVDEIQACRTLEVTVDMLKRNHTMLDMCIRLQQRRMLSVISHIDRSGFTTGHFLALS